MEKYFSLLFPSVFQRHVLSAFVAFLLLITQQFKMKMRTMLRICYATWWSFIRAWSITVKATNVPALVDVVSLLYCWRVSVWSELQQSNICFCCPSERHDGALCKRDDCGEMPGWQRLWWIWWVVARLLPDFEMNDCAESTSQCVHSSRISTESNQKTLASK